MEENFTGLEEKIFRYFLNDLECYASGKLRRDNFEDVFKSWTENRLGSPLFFNRYVNDFFYPELGITDKDLLIVTRQNKLSFKNYIIGIMNKFDVESYLMVDKIFNFTESEEDEELDAENIGEDTILAAKQLAIKAMSGVDDIDLSGMDSNELDLMMAKLSQREEGEGEEGEQTSQDTQEDKEEEIINNEFGTENLDVENLSDEDKEKLLYGKDSMEEKLQFIVGKFKESKAVRLICKCTGMNLDESKIVYDDIFKEIG